MLLRKSSITTTIRYLQEEERSEVQEARGWVNLPGDLLEVIIGSLNFVDRFHLACACKSWLSAARGVSLRCRRKGIANLPPFASPFLFLLARDCKECYLLDPLYGDKYTIPTPGLPSHVKILFCKGGWLLMLARDGASVFFFNPLTKATIDLPRFQASRICTFSVSHTPVSPDCVVFALNANDGDGCCALSFCRRGDKRWPQVELHFSDIDFISSHANPVFHEGSFYCLGNNGRLGVFDHTEETWTVLEKPEPTRSTTHQLYLTELDGELLWVRINQAGDSVRICMLDHLSSRWKELDGLGDRSLFVSKIASICGDGGQNENLTNKRMRRNGVYFGMVQDDEFIFYSCEEHRLLPRGDLDCAKDYSYSSCWIEPAFFQHSAEELRWSSGGG